MANDTVLYMSILARKAILVTPEYLRSAYSDEDQYEASHIVLVLTSILTFEALYKNPSLCST